MMRKIFYLMAMACMMACQNDDTDFSAYTNGTASTTHVISITYNENSVTVTGDDKGYVSTNGADVTVNAAGNDSLLLVLSGTTADGSLLVFRDRKYGIRLNGVSITNNDGPAINNQCGKALYMELAAGTVNTLMDGTAYDETKSYQQKGALFSEGEIIFNGTGALSVTGNCKNAIASDDYIVINDSPSITTNSSTGHGLKVNDGIWIHGGTLDISVTADAARGVKCDSVVVITGGDITIKTTGDCVYEEAEADYSSATCIKCDYPFTMTGGTLKMTSSGDGGKGLNCADVVTIKGGIFSAITTGDSNDGKPKAVKGDKGIVLSGGSFYAKVGKSWACDNGTDSELASERVTVVGTPSEASYEKKEVKVVF
jgi:hypothetical protein